MKKFNSEKIMKPNTVVRCTTEEDAKELLNWANSIGLSWKDGTSYNDVTYWGNCLDTIFYNLNEGTCFYDTDISDFEDDPTEDTYFNDNNLTVIDFKDTLVK